MDKQVVLVTGTPCVGKTTVAKLLASDLEALYVSLTELAEKESLTLRRDKQRETVIINETKMRKKLREIIHGANQRAIVIDGHYATTVTPGDLVTKVFVLRRNPIELKRMMIKRGFKEKKIWENLACEILDVCLVDALSAYDQKMVCETNVTGQTPESIEKTMLEILQGHNGCNVGQVDWLGMLESEGVLDNYLRV